MGAVHLLGFRSPVPKSMHKADTTQMQWQPSHTKDHQSQTKGGWWEKRLQPHCDCNFHQSMQCFWQPLCQKKINLTNSPVKQQVNKQSTHARCTSKLQLQASGKHQSARICAKPQGGPWEQLWLQHKFWHLMLCA